MVSSMVSKNNLKNKMEQTAARTPHYGIRKLSVGVASVLISTTLYMGATSAKADTLPSTATDAATTKPETASSSSSTQDNTTVDKTVETTTGVANNSTDTNVSTTTNAQASTTNTTAGATSSDKSGANSNSLVANNVESTANTTAQAQPKTTDVVDSDKTNVDNQVGSNVENKAETTTGTISTPTTPKRVVRRVRSLAAAPTTVNDPVDLTKWEYNVDSLGDAHVLSYNGDVTQPIYIPNSYDFIQAGKITAEHKAFITSDNMQKLAGSGTHELYISKNGNGKVIAEDSDWHGTFCGIGSRSGRNAQLSETIGKNLEKLDLTNLDVTNIQNMKNMFSFNSQLTSIGDLSNWDTHNVTDMRNMFLQASSLTNIGDLSNWDTSKVTNMSYMFLNTYNLTNIGDLSNWNVNNVIDSEDMMFAFGKGSKEPILQKLPSFTKTKNLNPRLPIVSTGTGVYDARGITSDVQRTSADNYRNNHIVLTSDTSLLDHSNISNNVNSKINQITINGNKITLPVFYKDYQDLHDTVQKAIDDYAEKLRSQGKIVKSTPKVADYSTEPTTDWLKYFTNYTIDVVSKTKINYVDTDGNTIHTTVIEGKSGETVSVPNEIPTGYKLVAGLSVPTEITFTADDYPITNLAIEAIHTTVTADNPKTTADKLPDNPTKNYPEGVSESDLNKTVTRTINITDPRTQKVTPVVQTVHLTRSADVDEITGKVVYSDWTTSSFDSYNVPEVPGYTATVQSIDEAPVDINSKDQTVDVSYAANPQSIKVNYVDSDNNDSVVKSDTLSGKTDQTVKTDIDIPDGYVVEGNVPSDYTFKANNADITIELKHTTVSVTSDSPKTTADKLPDNPSKNYPSGVAESDLNKTVTRTIKMTDPTGKVTTEIQTVHLTRSATVDEVTGDVIYSDWSTDSFDSYDVPVIEGYTASQSKVDTATVTGDTQNSEVNVTYIANPQSIKINYVDDDNGGATVKSDTLNGKTDETVKTGITIPENYSVVGTTPSEYTFKANGNTDITVHLKHVIDTTSEEKTVTRTIKVTDPTGKVTTIPQTTKVTRTVSTDKVTNQKTYGDWTTSSFDSYDVPIVEGYIASQSKVDKATVDGNSKDSEVNITYTANPQSIKINYVDSDNNGSVVKSDTLNGKTDQTVKTDIDIPDGYVVEGNVPSDYTFKAKDNADITVKLKHGTITVASDDPKTTGDKLPDNPSKNYPSGVAENDLNKTVTRTIKMTDPTGKVTTEIQTVHLTRTATVDEITGQVTYSDWTTGKWNSYNVPEVSGYTAITKSIDEVSVDSNTKDQTVEVAYTANSQSIKINYVDDDKSGVSVKSDALNGKTDQTVKTGVKIPDGYVVSGNVPTDYTFKATDNADITVHLIHNKVTVTPDSPKTTADKLPDNPVKAYPDGVSQNDLNKSVTRTINVTDPKGKVTTEIQTVHLTRTATVDEVTGQVTYSDWTTGSFDSYDVPEVKGYTASQDKVDEVKVISDTQDSEVNISYTANSQSIKINYVDGDNGDSIVKTDTLTGKTDETIKTGIKVPDGYVIDGNVPDSYTFKAKDNTDITVKLKHGTTTVTANNPKAINDKLPDNPTKSYPEGVGQNDLNKTVTRTIKVTTPDGKTTTTIQTVHLTRTATVDEVTGKVTYGDWSTGSFDSYVVPSVDGYTASQDKVDTATVTSDTQNSEVNITYTANDQAIKINYVDSDNNDSVVKSDTLSGKTDQTVKTGIDIPDGYVVEGNVPTDYTFKASGNADITVKLKHGTTTVTPDKPKTTGDKLPDNPSKSYPEGVAESDLNKTVTRTINVTDSQGEVTTTTQTVHLTRSATVDEVTDEVTYSDWSTGSFDSYNVPVIEGYTATQSNVDTAKVTSDTQNSEVNISYTANPQSIKINYVDDDKGGATVKSDALNGKTDETVKTGITIPENYTVVGTTLSEYAFKAKDNADITVHLKHVIDATSEEKTITRTIKVTNPNGGVMTIPQSAKSTRTVSTDKVTGEVTYGDWSKADLDGYDVPLIEGYTASQPSVAKTTVDGSSEDNVVEINYTPNKQVISIDYVDNGKVIATQVLTGKTDQTVKTNIQSPDKDKYVLVGNNPESYTFKAKDNADIRVEVKHVINDSTESKDVTRTIIVTRPDGKETTEVQKAIVSRTVHTDAVTGAKTYDEWSKATLDKYDVPVVDGYTPSLNVVEGLEVDGNSEDSVVKVGYTANEQTAKIVYVDGDNGNSIVKSDTLTGKTDETVKTGVKVPDGYVVDGQVPADYTFKAKDNADVTVKLKHGTTTVTPDKPKTANDKLPDTPTKSYPSGVAENDLNKDVTRTIKVTDPTGKVTTETQTVHLTRTATVDEVTGKVSYDDWSTGSFDSYDVPSVDGYTASQVKVDETKVTSDSTNNEVNITYTANPQSIKINYVDDTNGGTTVKSDTLNGKTDETVKTGITIPDGYEVEGQVPADYMFKAKDNADITVHLKHEIKTDADYKNVLRTIKVTLPNGKSESLVQVATLSREVKTDKVTNNVSYGSWSSDKFTSYKLPSIEGYTPSLDVVNEAKVDGNTEDSTVEVNYTANKQSAKVVYVDNGKVVATQTLTGKTDQTVKTNIQSPNKDKYVVVGNNPENYTFKAKDNEDIKVEVKHVVNTFKDYKNVIRSIEVTYPNGKTEKLDQVATLERTVHKDAVTGEETYSDWSTENWDSFTAPAINGYTADKDVKETVVTGNTTETTVNIAYIPNGQSINITYVDDDREKATVDSYILAGKTDETVKTGIKIPDGYTVEGSVPDSYTFKADGNSDITVHLKHNTVTVIPEKPKTTEDKLPNNPSKSYPKGVTENDLNKTVVRTIKVTTPDGKTTTTKQTVKLNRVAVVDEVTGQVTYSKWSIGELDRYDVPSIEGYTPSQDRVNMEVATSETKDSVVEISYTPNGQSINITYVDDDKGETTVDSYILAGKTDETVKTGIKIPDGYEVEGQVPTDYTFKAKDNTDITVRLKHKLDKGTETKTVSRIVEITLPDGQTKTIKQEQTLKRSKTTDLVTGDVVYGEWSKAEFDEVVAPEVDGYKPSQAKVEKETVDGNSSDQVVKITYKKVKSDVKVEAKPTVEAKHEAKVQVAPKVEAKASAKPQAKAQPKFVTTELPQTGEKQSKGTTIGAILVGLGSLLGLGALGKRKEK